MTTYGTHMNRMVTPCVSSFLADTRFSGTADSGGTLGAKQEGSCPGQWCPLLRDHDRWQRRRALHEAKLCGHPMNHVGTVRGVLLAAWWHREERFSIIHDRMPIRSPIRVCISTTGCHAYGFSNTGAAQRFADGTHDDGLRGTTERPQGRVHGCRCDFQNIRRVSHQKNHSDVEIRAC